jgi:non-heme chloroperoxidase
MPFGQLYVVGIVAGILLVAIAAIAGAIAFDGPSAPPPERSAAADLVHLPPISLYTARDGSDLAYRRYAGDPDRVVILIHGSAGSSIDMNALATALAAAGATVIVPDIRGHGQSGPHGDIAYIGQLEDDLDGLMTRLGPTYRAGRITLIGFSSGGGFALRIAGGRLGSRFSRFILQAPFLRYDAPNARSGTGSGGWTSVAVPRIAAG